MKYRVELIPRVKPVFLNKNRRSKFVVLPYKEFVALQEWIADAQDLMEIEAAKQEEGHLPRVPLEAIESELGLNK